MLTPEYVNTLHTAAEMKTAASQALSTKEEEAVARAINLAADTGEYRVDWTNPLSDSLKETLESKGYVVTMRDHAAVPCLSWEISWKG